MPSSSVVCTSLTISSSLAKTSRSGRGFFTLASSRSTRLVTDPEVGEEHLFAERGQLGRRVAAAEPIQDDEEGVAFADQGQALGIVRVRAGHQSGRIEELHRGRA